MAAERAFRHDERDDDGEPTMDNDVGAALHVEYRADMRLIKKLLLARWGGTERKPQRQGKRKKGARRG